MKYFLAFFLVLPAFGAQATLDIDFAVSGQLVITHNDGVADYVYAPPSGGQHLYLAPPGTVGFFNEWYDNASATFMSATSSVVIPSEGLLKLSVRCPQGFPGGPHVITTVSHNPGTPAEHFLFGFKTAVGVWAMGLVLRLIKSMKAGSGGTVDNL